MIDRDLIRKFSPSGLGTQVSLNHEGCSAGVDRKARLSLKRVVGGTVAFCHHCGDKGFVRDLNQDGTNLRKWLTGKADDMPRVSRLYAGHVDPVKPFSNPDIIRWMHQHHLPCTNDSHFNQVGDTGLRMTLYDPLFNIIGYQIRHFKHGAPKYTTHLMPTTHYDTAWFTGYPHTDILYIVEDYASAFRLKQTGVSSMALLKTSLSGNALTTITARSFKRIFVWLDGDDAGIKGTSKINARLRYSLPVGTLISYIGARNEPKWYDQEGLNFTVKHDIGLLKGM
jgi:hypothetical protein